MPERVRTETGLLLLIASQIGLTIIWPLYAYARSSILSPVFGYYIDQAIRVLLVLLFFTGGLLVVSGRRPFGPLHSEQTALGFAAWLGVTVFAYFVLPYFLPFERRLSAFTVTSIVGNGILLAGIVLLTYNLQSRRGKGLLWLAGIIGLGLEVAFDSQNLMIFPYYPTIVQQTILALNALSTGLFAAAFLAALARVRGDRSPILAEATGLRLH